MYRACLRFIFSPVVNIEETRSEAHGQVTGGHVILTVERRHVGEKVE